MDKILGQEIKDEKERLAYFKANCQGIEEKGYMRQFTPDEIDSKKTELAELSIKMNDIDIEKKQVMDDFKERLKPLGQQVGTLLENLKQKAEFVTEDTYKFIYEEERMVGYFNADGNLIEARPMKMEEMQKTMFLQIDKTGTND